MVQRTHAPHEDAATMLLGIEGLTVVWVVLEDDGARALRWSPTRPLRHVRLRGGLDVGEGTDDHPPAGQRGAVQRLPGSDLAV